MATILEARAVITAEDRTAAAFAAIEKRISSLSKSMRGIETISSKAGAVSRAVSSAALPQARAVSERVGSVQASARGMIAPMLRSIAPLTGAFAAAEVTREIVEKSAARMHEKIRMEVAGIGKAEIEAAERETAKLAQKFPSVSQTDSMHMLRNVRSVVGTYEEAAKIMEPLSQFRVVAESTHPGKEMAEEFDKLVKGMELKGVTQNIDQFKSYMNNMAKAINVFGDTLRPTDFYEMFKYGRQSTLGLSEDYITSVAPTLAQRLGGAQAGTAQSAFYNAIIGGHMTKTALAQLQSVGLVDPTKVIMPKGGHLAGVKPGGIVGSDVAATNPYRWVQDYFLPALAKHGITDPAKIGEIIATSFSKSTAAQFVAILATQQAAIEKDRALVHGAKGLDAADTFLDRDPEVAWQGLKNAFGNAAASIGFSNENLAHAMNALSSSLNEASAKAQGNPTGQDSPLQKSFNRMSNKALFEIDSDKDFRGAPVGDLVAAKREALKKAIEELPAKELQLYGVKQVLEEKRARDRAAGNFLPAGDTLQAGWRKHDIEGEIAEIKLAERRLAALDKTYATYRDVTARLPENLLINSKRTVAYPGSDHPAFPMSIDMFPAENAKPWKGKVPLPPRRPADLPGAPSDPADVDRAVTGNPYGGLPKGAVTAEVTGSIGVTAEGKIELSGEAARLFRLVQDLSVKTSGPLLNTGTSGADTAPGARGKQ